MSSLNVEHEIGDDSWEGAAIFPVHIIAKNHYFKVHAQQSSRSEATARRSLFASILWVYGQRKALSRLGECPGSSELSLLSCTIGTKSNL